MGGILSVEFLVVVTIKLLFQFPNYKNALVSTVTYINLIPQDQFDVGILNGEIRQKSGVDSNVQYNLYLSSFDGGSDGLLSEYVSSTHCIIHCISSIRYQRQLQT